MSINALTKNLHWSLSRARWIHFTLSLPYFFKKTYPVLN